MNRNNRFSPLVMALCVVVGIGIGTFYANHFSGNRLSIIQSGSNKLSNLLNIINDQYVDTVNADELVEKALPQILAELDPHSSYISVKEMQVQGDDLKSSFSGVGIEFTIREDTIHVQGVIANGPAERAGLVAGDKIVGIDGKPFVGKIVTTEEAMHRLKGPKDTKVKLTIQRYGEKKTHDFVLTRAEIPQKSIKATYMLNDDTGYIKISSFSENTYAEFLIALAELSQERFSKLVIDLRDNTGGYMEPAVQIANEFLKKNQLIVYMQGRKQPRKDFRSDGKGSYPDLPLVVLINEASASASEIFTGAMQDNDRATIIGRRSFGKGLVQQPISFSDGSMLRLTIARYYTPSGRCIQKPYSGGDTDGYQKELVDRYEHGEYFSVDSIKHRGPAYLTVKGRKVYGGGGITPDIFIAEDTLNQTSYYKQAAITGLIIQYAYAYTDANRATLKKYDNQSDLAQYVIKQNIVDKFATWAEGRGLKRRNLMIQKSHKLLEQYLVSRIIYGILDDNAWSQYLNQSDPTVLRAIEELSHK